MQRPLRRTPRARLARPFRPALLSSALLLAACSGGGGTSSTGGGATAAGEIVPLDAAARVDLPGRVSVFFQVLAENGEPLAGLSESDFELLENDAAVSASESQQRLLPRPQVFRAYSHLLLDRSGSVVSSEVGAQQQVEAAKAYVELVTATPETHVALSWFDGQAGIHPVIDFTDDRELLLEALDHLHDEPPLNPSTNLYGAVLAGLDALDAADLAGEQAGIAFRSLALVTFTDGTDQAGLASFDDAHARVDTVIDGRRRYAAFTIGLGDEIDAQVLGALGPSGAAFAPDFADLIPQFELVAGKVRDLANSFYLLSYCSPKQDGSGAHVLTVRVRFGEGSAEIDYPFSADWFGAGCGFLDVRAGLAGGWSYSVGNMVEDGLGRVWIAGGRSKPAGVESEGFVLRLSPQGELDEGFAGDGVLELAGAGGLFGARAGALVLAADGSARVGGVAGLASGAGRAALWKVSQTGVVQASWTSPVLASGGERVEALAFDSQQRLLAAGTAGSGATRTLVLRLDGGFDLDAGFGQGGVVLHESDGAHPVDTGVAVAVDSQDRVLVAGAGWNAAAGGAPDLKLLRLDANGTPDAGFAAGGVLASRGVFQSESFGAARALALDAFERPLLAGWVEGDAGQPQIALWRATQDGAPDASFAGSAGARFPGTGLVTLRTALLDNPRIDFGLASQLEDLALHSDGTILVCGLRDNGEGHTDLVIARFTESGLSHAGYNAVGFLIDDGARADDSHDQGRAVRIHSDGRPWVAGLSARPEAAGAPEPTVWIDAEPARRLDP